MSNKKNAERRVFDRVYGHFDLAPMETDPPDFICSPESGDSFGVEVTDFFLSESDARLHYKNGYSSDLLSGGIPRHKDDITGISVKPVMYYPNGLDGEGCELKSIPRIIPPQSIVVSKLLKAIEEKNQKVPNYLSEISPVGIVDLLIRDVDGVLRLEHPEDLTRHFSKGDAYSFVSSTLFREIYVITGSLCVPIRVSVFVSEVTFFCRVYQKYLEETGKPRTMLPFLESMARYLCDRFPRTTYLADQTILPVYNCGGYSVSFSLEQKIEVTGAICSHRNRWNPLASILGSEAIPIELQHVIDGERPIRMASIAIQIPCPDSPIH